MHIYSILDIQECLPNEFTHLSQHTWTQNPKIIRRPTAVTTTSGGQYATEFLEEILEDILEDFCPAKKSQKKRPPDPWAHFWSQEDSH